MGYVTQRQVNRGLPMGDKEKAGELEKWRVEEKQRESMGWE